MPAINERELAARALEDITKDGGYNNIVLRKTLERAGALPPSGRAFVTELVNGCLRNLIYVDHTLNHFSKTPTRKMKPAILNALRVGAYQLLFMDRVPPSAACDESVKLVKARGFHGLAPFVNGVLRSLARAGGAAPLPDKSVAPADYLSVAYSCPRWIVDYWLSFMGFEAVEAMCAANVKRPRVTVCVNTLRTDREALVRELALAGVDAEAHALENALLLSRTADVAALSAFGRGLFHVMDAGAMAAVRAMDPQPGETVLDVCAAPGGKSLFAAICMRNSGKIFSFDKHAHKIKMIEEAASRLGVSIIEAREADAATLGARFENTADRVLVDAPCSGLGLLRKKSDIKYTRQFSDVAALAGLQREILAGCRRCVKPGGVLLYCTCTVSKAENEDNVAWFTENFDFKLENIQEHVVELPQNVLQSYTTRGGALTLLPHEYEGDGFFIAKLRRPPG